MADISSDKIKQLLSDPKNIELIAGLAGSMNGGILGSLVGNSGKEMGDEPESEKVSAQITEPGFTDNSEKLGVPDENSVPASSFPDLSHSFSPVVNSINSDKRIALLKAIKPYISDSKKERVDGLVRAISVAGILNNYKGGLFG